MNKRKMIKTGIVLAIAMVPLHAYAVSRQAGLEACAEALVNDMADNQGSPMAFNLDTSSNGGKKKLGRREVFHLDAINPEDEEVVARMDCFVNNKAEVKRLIRLPLDGEDARVRATTYNH